MRKLLSTIFLFAFLGSLITCDPPPALIAPVEHSEGISDTIFPPPDPPDEVLINE